MATTDEVRPHGLIPNCVSAADLDADRRRKALIKLEMVVGNSTPLHRQTIVLKRKGRPEIRRRCTDAGRRSMPPGGDATGRWHTILRTIT